MLLSQIVGIFNACSVGIFSAGQQPDGIAQALDQLWDTLPVEITNPDKIGRYDGFTAPPEIRAAIAEALEEPTDRHGDEGRR